MRAFCLLVACVLAANVAAAQLPPSWSVVAQSGAPIGPFSLDTRDLAGFRFSAPAGTQFTVSLSSSSGDGDIYVKVGAPPTSYSDSTVRSTNGGSRTDSVSYTPSTSSDVYVSVFAYSACTVTLTCTFSGGSSGGDLPASWSVIRSNIEVGPYTLQQRSLLGFTFVSDHSQDDAEVTVVATSGDPDIYVYCGSNIPSSYRSFPYSSTRTTLSDTVTFPTSPDDTCYVVILAYNDCTFTVTADYGGLVKGALEDPGTWISGTAPTSSDGSSSTIVAAWSVDLRPWRGRDITLFLQPRSSDLDLSVYIDKDMSGSADYSSSVGGTGRDSVNWYVSSTQQFAYLAIVNYANEETDYDVTFTLDDADPGDPDGDPISAGLVAGIVVGGMLAVFLVCACVRCQRRRSGVQYVGFAGAKQGGLAQQQPQHQVEGQYGGANPAYAAAAPPQQQQYYVASPQMPLPAAPVYQQPEGVPAYGPGPAAPPAFYGNAQQPQQQQQQQQQVYYQQADAAAYQQYQAAPPMGGAHVEEGQANH